MLCLLFGYNVETSTTITLSIIYPDQIVRGICICRWHYWLDTLRSCLTTEQDSCKVGSIEYRVTRYGYAQYGLCGASPIEGP